MARIQMMEEKVYPLVLDGILQIDSGGRIWRLKKRGWDRWKGKAVLRVCKRVRAEHDQGSYLMVRAMIDKQRYHAQASRLVYRHFYGPMPANLVINHKNGDKKDNHPQNLEAVTAGKNITHAIRVLGTHPASDQWADRNPNAKLTKQQVKEIKQRRRTGEHLLQIAQDYNISFQHVSKIAKGKTRSRG